MNYMQVLCRNRFAVSHRVVDCAVLFPVPLVYSRWRCFRTQLISYVKFVPISVHTGTESPSEPFARSRIIPAKAWNSNAGSIFHSTWGKSRRGLPRPFLARPTVNENGDIGCRPAWQSPRGLTA